VARTKLSGQGNQHRRVKNVNETVLTGKERTSMVIPFLSLSARFLDLTQRGFMITYRVRVKLSEVTYLWGGKEVKEPFPTKFHLFFRVDDNGERIKFGVRVKDKKSGPQETEVGILYPGESFSIPLDNLTGVYAACTELAHTFVDCTVINAID
jgi:hypothetical protein